MTPFHRAAALAGLLLLGCEFQQPKPAVPTPTPSYDCTICGDLTRYAAHIFRVEPPAIVKAGKPAPFLIYAATGLDKLMVCDTVDAKAEDPDWGVSADGKGFTLGLIVKAVKRDEAKPCPYIDRNVPPQAVAVTKQLTFPQAGTYELTVVGYDGSRPLGMTWSPAPGQPDTPPAPNKPLTIEVVP